MDKLQQYNDNFGCPPAHLPAQLQAWCRKIYAMKGWKDFFQCIDIPCPSAINLCQWLEHCVIESDRRGYHKNVDVNLLPVIRNNYGITSKHMTDKWCMCGGPIHAIPSLSDATKQTNCVLIDMLLMKYIGDEAHYKPNQPKVLLRPRPTVQQLKYNVLQVTQQLISQLCVSNVDIRYKMVVKQGDKQIDATGWIQQTDINNVFVNHEQQTPHELYFSKDCPSSVGDWRVTSQKYIIDLDCMETKCKPFIIPHTLIETNKVSDASQFNLTKAVDVGDIIYYVAPAHIVLHKKIPVRWFETAISVNYQGYFSTLSDIYKCLQQRTLYSYIASLFETFIANRSPKASQTENLFTSFQNYYNSKYYTYICDKRDGALVWYQPNYEPPKGVARSEKYLQSKLCYQKYTGNVSSINKNGGFANEMCTAVSYCGTVIKHRYVSGFYEISPKYPARIPTTTRPVLATEYQTIPAKSAIVSSIMMQRGYNLSIQDILSFHHKHSQLIPIQHCQAELQKAKSLYATTKPNKLLCMYFNDERSTPKISVGEPEIVQLVTDRSVYVGNFPHKLFLRVMDFVKTPACSNDGCEYRNLFYSSTSAKERNAANIAFPNLNVPQWDPFERPLLFEYQTFAARVQAFDESTHRWFNANVVQFKSMSAIVIYDDWDPQLYRDKISLMSNHIVQRHTYLIHDNRIGFIDQSLVPKHFTQKELDEEYEAKIDKETQREIRREKNKQFQNEESIHRYFFEAVADNKLSVVMQFLQPLKREDKEYKWDMSQVSSGEDNKEDEEEWSDDEDGVCDKLKCMQRKIDVNMTDVNGRTPLFICAYKGYLRMFRLLIEYGANINVRDVNNTCVLDAARQGFDHAMTEMQTIVLQQIIDYLEANMKQKKKTPNHVFVSDTTTDIKGNLSRQNVGNDETISTSSLIYIGNLPYNMAESELRHFLRKFYIVPLHIRQRGYFAIVRTRQALKKLRINVKKMNGTFYKGAMVKADIFGDRSSNATNGKKQEKETKSVLDISATTGEQDTDIIVMSEVQPNRGLFVNNFDVRPGIYGKMTKIFETYGKLARPIQIHLNKFGDPYAKVLYMNVDDATLAYDAANAPEIGLKLWQRMLRLTYSTYVPPKEQMY